MTGIEHGILAYDSSLTKEDQARLDEIGRADVVIGIPTHRNGRTIGEVLAALSQGVRKHLSGQRVVLMNADGGSSDNTVRLVHEAKVSDDMIIFSVLYQGIMGKGTGIRAILEAAARLEARACLVTDARVPGIRPDWVPALVRPVLTGVEAALACYQKSAYAAALGDNLTHPFLRTFFCADLEEALPGEFCVSGALAAELAGCDVWETDVAKFGVNMWLTSQLLVEERHIVQVDMGPRGDDSGDPGAVSDARFLHTVGTLFRLLTIHRRLWRQFWESGRSLRHYPFSGPRCADRSMPCPDCVQELWDAFMATQSEVDERWKPILRPDTLERVVKLYEQDVAEFDFAVDLWVRVVMDFAVAYNKGEGDPDKVADAFLPLYYGRAATYVRQTMGMTPGQRASLVDETTAAFMRARPYFLELWDDYEPWIDSSAGYWH